jgi:hypothetical protein
MSGLRQALARRWDWLWRRREEDLDPPADRQRRFWSEFREGQRDAEETSSTNAWRTGPRM